MCGRYTLAVTFSELRKFFELSPDYFPLFEARYNIAPTQPVMAVREFVGGGPDDPIVKRELAHFAWGLIPSWSKQPDMGGKLINARAETILEKPTFRNSFKRRRCLI